MKLTATQLKAQLAQAAALAASGPDFSSDKKAPDILEHQGRFYINMGRPGYNSHTNNRDGYETKKKAQDVIDGKRSRFA